MAIKRSKTNKRKAPEHQGDTRPKWRKVTNGTHYHSDGQVVTKGEILYAHEWELSNIVKAGFTNLDALPAADLGKTLSVKSRGGGWYDVVNTVTMQKLNSKPLRREAAESFLPDGQTLEDAVDGINEETEDEE
jgi:hypothetical protein